MPNTNRKYDVAVIGAGHNGLTAACLLAKAGRSVVVFERRNVTGGLCAGEEFSPGYTTAGLLHDTTGVRRWVADKLSLQEHGLEFSPEPLSVFSPQREGKGLLLSQDAAKTSREIESFSTRDAAAYAAYRSFIGRARKVINPLRDAAPPDLVEAGLGGMLGLFRQALGFRRLGKREMMELIRIPPMCVADWLGEHFETELLRATLAAPAILGTWTGPWSPGSAANLLLWECAAEAPVAGGPSAVVYALERAAGHHGVDVRTGAKVERILITNNRAQGVELAGGETVAAAVVVSSCDPKTTFLDLVDAREISHEFEQRVRQFRTRGTTAKVHLALDKPLEFRARPGEVFEYVRTGEEVDQLERAFDPVKYRQFAKRPILDVFVPNVSRPELAPDGHAVVSILAHFVPHRLEGGWSDERREELGDAVVSELESYAPGVSKSVVAREILTPADVESRYGVTDGHVFHGEHSLDQIVTRPTPETARYATPVNGLFICGSGSHPGGGVTCAPGALAASEIIARG